MENNSNDKRLTERLDMKDLKWKPCDFMDLKKGDIFRLFDDGDDPEETGNPTIATNDVFLNEDKIGSINCEPYEGKIEE